MEHSEKKGGTMETLVNERKIDIGFLLAGTILGIFLGWNIVEILIFVVFIWSIVGPIKSRYLAWPALFFLSFTPILLLLKQPDRAEEFSIYAYYFLVMVVVRGIIESKKEEESR